MGPKLSRRRFIKGVIYSSAAAASGAGYYLASAQSASNAVVERLLSLHVNGQTRRVDVPKQETLVMTLRYKLGLVGSKVACDRAECGSCTVLIDGSPHYACSILTHSVRDREVTTIEGLAGPNGELHPVQQAWIEEQVPQCGFCQNGMMIKAAELLDETPSPTVAQIRDAFMSGPSPHLCRCGTYSAIVEAVKHASTLMAKAR